MSNVIFLILVVLAIVNIAAFIIVGLDKRNSVKGDDDRYPEVSFFLMATIFGSLGIFLGLFIFRHKTQKIYFPLGIGFILIQQLVLLILSYNLYLTK
ncbi:MAG: DUF1294 domain-containing protein [Candidatus Doudnabacteria bacterium]|jgi:uncharacterized membrane protein YsdA (DUF1294 family)